MTAHLPQQANLPLPHEHQHATEKLLHALHPWLKRVVRSRNRAHRSTENAAVRARQAAYSRRNEARLRTESDAPPQRLATGPRSTGTPRDAGRGLSTFGYIAILGLIACLSFAID